MCDRDSTVLREVLERKTLRAVITAIGKLAREAAGHPTFDRDVHFHACAALARLAPSLLGPATQAEEIVDPVHPAYRHVAEQLMDEMEELRAKARAELGGRQDEADQQKLLTDGGEHA
jgi:hypothetical protein